RDDPRPDLARSRPRDAGAGGGRPGAPRQARSQRPRRSALSASVAGDRRARRHAGRGPAGTVPRRVERFGRADLRGLFILMATATALARRAAAARENRFAAATHMI